MRIVEEEIINFNREHNLQNKKSPYFHQKKRESIVRPLQQLATELYTDDELHKFVSILDLYEFRMIGPQRDTLDNLGVQRKEIIKKLDKECEFLTKFHNHKQSHNMITLFRTISTLQSEVHRLKNVESDLQKALCQTQTDPANMESKLQNELHITTANDYKQRDEPLMKSLTQLQDNIRAAYQQHEIRINKILQ